MVHWMALDRREGALGELERRLSVWGVGRVLCRDVASWPNVWTLNMFWSRAAVFRRADSCVLVSLVCSKGNGRSNVGMIF